jgi:hypothetical protein
MSRGVCDGYTEFASECVVRTDLPVIPYNPIFSFISYCWSDPMSCFCSTDRC